MELHQTTNKVIRTPKYGYIIIWMLHQTTNKVIRTPKHGYIITWMLHQIFKHYFPSLP